MKKVLLAGESFIRHETHMKGFDTFHTTHYEECANELQKAIKKAGYELDYLPSHLVPSKFPYTAEEMKEYSLIILSDIGANSLHLSDDTFYKGKFLHNRTEEIAKYVKAGGSFLMIGGYLTFQGINAVGNYAQTAINDILPVEIQRVDDRMEMPEGVRGKTIKNHPILEGISEWPRFLGYNKTFLRDDDTVEELATINGDPLIAIRECGKGKTAVFTSDCAPHWGSPEFMSWNLYDQMWGQLIKWLAQ